MEKLGQLFLLCCGLILGLDMLNATDVATKSKRINNLRYQTNATINGKHYYINTDGLPWNESFGLCQSNNQVMVSFDDEGEYIALEDWLKGNGLAAQWYWTSGWRNFDTWQWQSTGENVSDSNTYWIEGQPSAPIDGRQACMSFAPELGWDDDSEDMCLQMYLFATICE